MGLRQHQKAAKHPLGPGAVMVYDSPPWAAAFAVMEFQFVNSG